MANSLSAITQQIEKLLGLLGQIDGFAKGGGVTGGGNFLSGSLASVSTVAPGASGLAVANKLVGTGLTTIAGVMGGASQMMPDVAMTIGRASGFYGAAVASGGDRGGRGMSTAELDRGMRLGLGQFQNIPGGSAKVAGLLAGRGMMPGSATFSQTVTSVGQAARYLNMPNDVAASAIEGLTSGPTSGMMMRNFGVFTSNPVTGEAMSQGQIFEQLATRMLGGRETSVERTMDSLRRGNLGSNIRNSGMDPAQQALFSQYMIDRARGVNMDLSDPNAISDAIARNNAAGISNPLLDSMRLTSKNDELMSYATEEYQKGITEATDALIMLSDTAVKPLIDSMGMFKATLDTFFGSNVGAGAGNALASLAGGALAGGMVLGGMRGAGKGSTPASGKTPGGKGGGFKMRAGGPIGLVAGLAGNVAGNLISGGSEQGSVQSKLGSAISYGATGAGFGAMLGSFIPGPGTAIGAAIGGVAGLAYGAFVGGQESAYAGNSSGGGSLTGNINPGSAGSGWKGGFGEKRYYGSHQGIDIPLAEGTKVYAAASGKVIAAQSGSGPMSYGLYVKIQHSDKYVTFYAHLSRIDVSVGQEVAEGQLIGLSGNTGFSTGPHLHFGLFRNGTAIDPSGYVGNDLTGGVEKYAASNNGGKSKKGVASTGGSIVDRVVSPGASLTSANSAISVTTSGVKGRSLTSSAVVGSTMKGGITGLSSPVLGSMGAGTASNTQSTGSGGGLDVFVPVSFSSTVAGRNQNTMVLEGHSSGGSVNNVSINVSVAQATETEARRFAKMVKQYLEDDKTFDRIGRK
jgi:murein DD-endopeptidase MepM/ murein hydrolase activator NlpD